MTVYRDVMSMVKMSTLSCLCGQIERQSALQTSQKDKNDRIPVTLIFHPHNHAVKTIITSVSVSFSWSFWKGFAVKRDLTSHVASH